MSTPAVERVPSPRAPVSGELTLPFGKYEGWPLSELPVHYLCWLLSQVWFRGRFNEHPRDIGPGVRDALIERLRAEREAGREAIGGREP